MPAAKYKFVAQEACDHDIGTTTGGVIGTLRVKPSTILWKPKGAKGKAWFSVTLDEFIAFAQQKNYKVTK